MKITIELTDVDKPTVDGFAAATGWTDKLGKTAEEWLYDRITSDIQQKAMTGAAMIGSRAEREAYQTAFRSAMNAAKTAISKPSGGGISTKPPTP